jgi:parallel beta-helix repeat protein
MFRSCHAPSARCYRPCLETLEDRTLLSTYLVDRLTDTGAGSGLSGDLRYCIGHAADGDKINFGVTGTINLAGELPHLTHSINIEGPGAPMLTIQAPYLTTVYQVFFVDPGPTAGISGLTIGTTASDGIYNGGTLTVSNCTVSDTNGGACIDNSGTLTVSDCTLSDNTFGIVNGGIATVSDSTISGNYIGIYNFDAGTLALTNSNVIGNGGEADEGGFAGGITNRGTLNITGSTIADNYGFGDSHNYAAGITNLGTLNITGSTIAANLGPYGGIRTDGAPLLDMRNTILAGNIRLGGSSDLFGSLSSSGYNLIGNSQGGSGYADTDLLNVDPLLGPLQNNGGPTQTMALLAGSPALNAGDAAFLGTADQRGVVRSGGVNIGAYQASATAFLLTTPVTVTAGTAFNLTVKAVDPFGQVARGYTGTVTFSSTDPNPVAVLPAAYPFTLGDAGQHPFPGGVTLLTAGSRAVTATDTVTGSITGSATVTVTPAAADHLLFLQQPTNTAAGQTISPVIVEVVDQFGNVETSDNTDTITLSLGSNPSGGTLSGTLTVTVVNGVATFSNLSIDLAGAGYTLHATVGGGVPDLDSNPFTITM